MKTTNSFSNTLSVINAKLQRATASKIECWNTPHFIYASNVVKYCMHKSRKINCVILQLTSHIKISMIAKVVVVAIAIVIVGGAFYARSCIRILQYGFIQ